MLPPCAAHKDLGSHLTDYDMFATSIEDGVRGKGKGDKTPKVPALLALQDGDPKKEDAPPEPRSEVQLLEEAMVKARKMRDLAAKTIADFEEGVTMVSATQFWSKKAKTGTDLLKAHMEESLKQLKQVMGSKTKTLELLKQKMIACGQEVKTLQAHDKEHKQLANKTFSKASGSKSKIK